MTRDDVLKIIKEENLHDFNFYENRHNKEDEVGIKYVNGYWIVYATDERASIVTGSEVRFDDEEIALENFVKRLRASEFLRKSK
ncbi:hypothetical protein FL857_12180 [Criibacterium bergeronii]|uniref:Uncharacterized protein n=1 Tax=Criibacterium bergeronii TaxID=1871336 RepID=A0A552USC1_9FIRM|nr:Imm59 family immunity protein [Criibacterium bergeronii]TRW21077.1 hypothetical protein FL857_12180 [Criibacterium bergeronii]